MGWNVLQMPAPGTNSNVSALVVPGVWPVVDDDRQLPMFPSSDPGRDLLFHVIELQAESVRLVAAMNHALLQKAHSPRPKPADKTTPRPQNEQFRDWKSSRTRMQHLEREVRRNNQLDPDDRVTKTDVCTLGGLVTKTLTRIMTETYGLHATQWPPSTWPETPPKTP